jgi:hypothetical protein
MGGGGLLMTLPTVGSAIDKSTPRKSSSGHATSSLFKGLPKKGTGEPAPAFPDANTAGHTIPPSFTTGTQLAPYMVRQRNAPAITIKNNMRLPTTAPMMVGVLSDADCGTLCIKTTVLLETESKDGCRVGSSFDGLAVSSSDDCVIEGAPVLDGGNVDDRDGNPLAYWDGDRVLIICAEGT